MFLTGRFYLCQVIIPPEFIVTPQWEILDNYNEWKALLHFGLIKHPLYALFPSAVLNDASSFPLWNEKVGRYLETHGVPAAGAAVAAAPPAPAAAAAPLPAVPVPAGDA